MTQPPSLRSRQRQRTEQEIRDAALRLFTEQGSAETTVDQIAESAGISTRTFFRYFDTKESAAAPKWSYVWAFAAEHLAQVDSLASARDALIAGFHDMYRDDRASDDSREFERMQRSFELAAVDGRVRHELGSGQAALEADLFEVLSAKIAPPEHFELRLLISTAVAANRTIWIHWCETDADQRDPGDIPALHDKAYGLIRSLFG